MAIYRGGAKLKAYRGDHKPVNVYHGANKVAGWHIDTQADTGPLTFANTYNDTADVTLAGNVVQGTPTPDDPVPVTPVTGNFSLTSSDGSGKEHSEAIPLGANTMATLADGTADTVEITDAKEIKLIKRLGYVKPSLVDVGVFAIKHSAGLLDFSVVNATGVLWVFPDDTTSTLARPAKTVTAGTTYLTVDSWQAAGLQLLDNGTDALWTGTLADLPRVTGTLNLYGCSRITGSLADAPRVTGTLILDGCSRITGSLADAPRVTGTLSLSGCSRITGSLADAPRVTTSLNLYGCSQITGSLADAPRVTGTLNIDGCSQITGSLADAPRVTGTLSLNGCSQVTGSLADAPRVTNYLILNGCSQVTGVLSPTATLKTIYLSGTGMTPSDTDQTLVSLAAITTVTSGGILRIRKNRTSASDAAFAYLSGRFAITEVVG